jgi:hypothetical protein
MPIGCYFTRVRVDNAWRRAEIRTGIEVPARLRVVYLFARFRRCAGEDEKVIAVFSALAERLDALAAEPTRPRWWRLVG